MPHVLTKHKKGDTFPGERFKIKQVVSGETTPVDLTDTEICMDVRTSPTGDLILRLTNYETNDPLFPGGGIVVTSEVNGEFMIAPQIIDIKPATYVYDVEFRFPGDTPEDPRVIKTLFDGSWQIVQDITHG